MEFNGDKFLRNLEIERERAELERQKEELMSQKTQSYMKASNRYKEDEPETELNFQELDDIRLNKDSSNKQKYILLGFILVLLFLITIVTIKLISEPKNGNPFGQNDVVDEKKMENGLSTVTPPQLADANETKGLDIDKIIQSEDNLNAKPETPVTETATPENKPTEGDIFGIAKENNNVASPVKPVNEAVVTKPAEPKKVPETIQTQTTQVANNTPTKVTIKNSTVIKEVTPKQKPQKEIKKDIIKKFEISEKNEPKKPQVNQVQNNGPVYIQVGVFSTVPDKELIVQLQKNNYKYTFQKLEKDGKQYSKLLVGGYSSKDKALEDLVKIRNEINPKAFIPKGQ